MLSCALISVNHIDDRHPGVTALLQLCCKTTCTFAIAARFLHGVACADGVKVQTHGRADLTEQQACPPSGCHARSTELLCPRTSFPIHFSSRRRRSKGAPSVSRSWASKSAVNGAASIDKTPSIVSMSGQAAGTTLLSSYAASKASSTDIAIQASSSSGWLEAISASLATLLRIVVGKSHQTAPTPRQPTARMMTLTI